MAGRLEPAARFAVLSGLAFIPLVAAPRIAASLDGVEVFYAVYAGLSLAAAALAGALAGRGGGGGLGGVTVGLAFMVAFTGFAAASQGLARSPVQGALGVGLMAAIVGSMYFTAAAASLYAASRLGLGPLAVGGLVAVYSAVPAAPALAGMGGWSMLLRLASPFLVGVTAWLAWRASEGSIVAGGLAAALAAVSVAALPVAPASGGIGLLAAEVAGVTGAYVASSPRRALEPGGLALLAFALAFLAVAGVGFREDLQWWRPVVVVTGSMEPAYERGDIVILRAVRGPEDVTVGDVVAYRLGDTIVVHRVVGVAGEGVYITKGDANDSPDPRPVTLDDIIGEAAVRIPKLGWALIALNWNPKVRLAAVTLLLTAALYLALATMRRR